MLYTPITKKAIRYCFESHAGQFDKSGIPYVTHPLHLAEPADVFHVYLGGRKYIELHSCSLQDTV